MTDTQKLINQLRDRADAIGMDSLKSGTRPELAIFGDIANELTLAADALEATTVAPAVDREALAREMYAADFWGDENAHRDWDELIAHPVHFERYRARADALIASGILRDVRDVQAEGAGLAADWLAQQLWPDAADYAGHVRQFAQAIREARNER